MCSTRLSTIFQLHHGMPIYWWRIEQEYLEKTADLPQVSEQLYHTHTPKVWDPINQCNPVTLLFQDLDFQCHGNFYIQYDLMARGDCSLCSILAELLTITV